MESKSNLKPLSKMQEMNLRSLKLKEESISTLLTTIKSNQKFAKLLIFTLNSLQGFVSPPNREIRINSSIIIKLNGLDVLHLISVMNITKDEIIALAGDIFYKLIYINDIFDKELTKLFAEKNGHKLIIDIVLKRKNEKNNDILLPYIKIINGLTHIPQLIPTLIENNIIDAINLNLDENEQEITYDKVILQTKLETLKQISIPKIGRDYLIKNNYSKKIINILHKCTEKKDAESVLSGLGILENLCRNEEGVNELKNSDIINCLTYICNLLGYSQAIIKMNAKIFYKVASAEDLKAQLELLKQYYEENKASENYENNFKNINSSLELVSNFILVDELCLLLKEEEYFELLKNLFIQIQQINLENRDKEFISLFISVGKNFMNIFYRLFALVPSLMENNEGIIKQILNSISKNWDITSKNIEDNNNLITFNSYFTSYGEIFNQTVQTNSGKLKNEIVDNLIYINKNILISGDKYLNADENNITPHRIACVLMKICNEISLKSNETNIIEKKEELIQSLEECYQYLEFLFIKIEDEEILSYVLELIYDLVNSKQEFKENKLSQIIFKICEFMLKKNNQRYPCLQCMKLLDIFISQENDINKDETQKFKYIDCIVNVMTFNDLDINTDEKKQKIENDINTLGDQILEKLLTEDDFNKLLKEFCDSAESFSPNKKNKDLIDNLENYIKRMTGIIEIKNYFEIGAEKILTSLKSLLEKEIKHIEFFKKDKTNEKIPDFYTILEHTSSRILLELNLNIKHTKISQQKNNFEILVKTLEIIFNSLNKSTDKRNTKYLLNNLKLNYSYIIDNESNIKLPNNENIVEKIINMKISLIKKLIEEDDIIFILLNNLIYLVQKNSSFNNYIIKAGCPRLLLQIIESSLNEQNVQCALTLLKLVCGSNEDNLKMISNQNAMNVFFQAKKKFEGNNSIIKICDDISNEILILPEQENYASDLISENIKQFNINSKKDFADNEVRTQLLSSLQIISSFVSNQTQADVINSNEEFLENFKETIDKTLKENELDSLNEKLVNSELSLLNKINNSNHKYFGYDYVIDKSIDIIKNKSKYQDILIKATSEFLKYLSVQSQYQKHIASKMDTSFIDCVFDDIDNCLGDIQETKDLNNILFYLCLYNEEFSSYIKKKGGLKNVFEELKSSMNNKDKSANATKLNSLKMLYSLCNDKNEVEDFAKSGGNELLNKIIEDEIEIYKDYLNDFSKDLFKVREIPTNVDDNCDKDFNAESNNVIVYDSKILFKIIDIDEKYFNDKIINELIFLSEAYYPKKDIFVELCQLLLKDNKYLPNDENYLFLLLKNAICLKGKYYSNKEFIANVIDKVLKLILPKIFESNNYFTNLSTSLKENSSTPLQLCYLSKIVSYYDKNYPDKQIQMFDDIEKFVIDYIKYYKDKENNNIKEDISASIAISLLNAAIYILKYKKENIQDIVDNMNIFIFMCQQNLFKKGFDSFTFQFLTKCNLIFDNMEQNENKNRDYIKYLNNIIPKSIETLINIHQNISTQNKYSSIEEINAFIFDIILKYLKDIFTKECAKENINNIIQIKFDVLLNIICNLITDFNQIEDIDENKRKNIIEDLYIIILGLLSKLNLFNEDENLTQYMNTILKLLDNMKESKDKFNVIPKIINNIINNIDISQDLFDKNINLILSDLKTSPPFELEFNLDSLALLTKEVNRVRSLIDNDEFSSVIISLYKDKENLTSTQRKNITTIYTNLFKNTYNTELILNKNPELIKTIMVESEKENTNKEEENSESQKNELNIVVSILKDKNNANQLLEKNLITKENINNIINNYENTNDEKISEPLNDLKNIYESININQNIEEANEENNDKNEENENNENKENKEKEKIDVFQSEKALLVNLKEKIDQAYEEHLKKLNREFNEEEFKNNFDDNVAEISDLTTISKKRKISITSDIILNNFEENNKLSSPISASSNDEMSSSLDNLISLIRLLHLKYKTSSDDEIIKERIDLIKQSFYLLKKYTICPENHKNIIELGLISFIEKLIVKEEYQIYLAALEVLKNCTYSENAVQELLLSIYYENFVEEIANFYENMTTINENKENRECFYYDNIILNNIIKSNQGFDSIMNNMGIEKVLLIAKNTANVNMWNSTIIYLNNKLKDPKENKEELVSKLINDILLLIKKIFDINPEEINENLFNEALKLIANVYNKKNEESFNNLNIINVINNTFDKLKNNNEYLENIILLLQALCSDNKAYFNQIIENNLINKISEQMNHIEQKDDLINNFSNLLFNILTTNESEKNLCSNEIINHILDYINKYTQKLDSNNDNNNGQTNENGENRTNVNKNIDENSLKVYNSILNNYLKIIKYFSSDEKNTDIINEKYHDALSNTIKKTKLDIPNIIICLIYLNYYYNRTPKDQWKNVNIQNIYLELNTLKETYYSNSDILVNISNLVGVLLKGVTLKFLIERFYSLILDSINSQDWNEKLVTSTLYIIKDCLLNNEDLQNEVFENTQKTILNLLKLFPNSYTIVLNGYDILTIFIKNEDYIHVLLNSDLISLIRSSLLNQSFNVDKEQDAQMKLMIYKLLHYLSNIHNKDINGKISLELMECMVNDLKVDDFSEYLNEITKILINIFKNKLAVETLVAKSGLDALSSCLDKFYENKIFVLNVIIILRDIIFSSNENKEKVKNGGFKDKIQNILDKTDDKNKKLKMEAKILIYNLNYVKKEKTEENKNKKLPFLEYIDKENLIKNNMHHFMTRGIPIKAQNPKGKIKEFIFCFSPDLMKLYLKKPKIGNIPPKAKYTLETPLIKDVIQNYTITNFKKGGVINKPPEKQLCLAIEQDLIEGQKAPKTLALVCFNNDEANLIWGCVEIIVDYIKNKCGKEHKCKIDDFKEFFKDVIWEQLNSKTFDIKKTVFLKSKMK